MKTGTHEFLHSTLCHGSLDFFLWSDWNTSYFVTKKTKKNTKFDEFTIAHLKMWPKLLGQKYTYNKLNDQLLSGFGMAFLKSWLEPHREHWPKHHTASTGLPSSHSASWCHVPIVGAFGGGQRWAWAPWLCLRLCSHIHNKLQCTVFSDTFLSEPTLTSSAIWATAASLPTCINEPWLLMATVPNYDQFW